MKCRLIDSNIIIWGIKKQASKGQEENIDKALYLFDWFDENKHEVFVPTCVVAEILVIEPIEKYGETVESINNLGMIIDFDLRAASRYAQIIGSRLAELKQIAKDPDIKNKMKIDHMIVSTALVHGANAIYTTDSHLNTFANGLIEVRDLPNLPAKQTDLFNS